MRQQVQLLRWRALWLPLELQLAWLAQAPVRLVQAPRIQNATMLGAMQRMQLLREQKQAGQARPPWVQPWAHLEVVPRQQQRQSMPRAWPQARRPLREALVQSRLRLAWPPMGLWAWLELLRCLQVSQPAASERPRPQQ